MKCLSSCFTSDNSYGYYVVIIISYNKWSTVFLEWYMTNIGFWHTGSNTGLKKVTADDKW